MKGRCRVDVQQLEEAWAARAGAREARLVAASHVPAALSLLGIARPGDRLVAFADDFADAFARGFDGCDVALVGSPSAEAFAAASEGFDASFDAEGPHLWWFVNSIGGFGLRVPDLRALGRATREAHALLVVDNTVASAFGCDPLRLGAALSLEALDRVCAGKAPRKLVATSVARSQLKRHRVDAAAECAHALFAGCSALAFDLSVEEADVLKRGLDSLDARMQAHFDRARALAEYLAANEMVRNVRCFARGVSHIARRRRNDAPFSPTRQAGEHRPPLRRHRRPLDRGRHPRQRPPMIFLGRGLKNH